MRVRYLFALVIICRLFICNELQAQVLLPSFKDTHDIELLNGLWKFKYVPSSEIGADSTFYTPSFDVSRWSNIRVPGNWELQGFNEPMYGKKLKNGTGLYRTIFKVPINWKNNPVYIAFDGVLYGYTIWINGHYAGSFASSFNRHISDISAFVLPGRLNTLAVKVITHPKGWEFDTNDSWSLSGIFRDVSLFSLPVVHFKDMTIQTFTHHGYADVAIKAAIGKMPGAKIPAKLKLTGRLYDPAGKEVKSFTVSTNELLKNLSTHSFTANLQIDHPLLWSAESPYLYTLRLSLQSDKTTIKKYSTEVGIREISWADGVLRLNGAPIKLKGVTHHELLPVDGKAMTEVEMKKDLLLMNRANINFIRTSHYPPDPEFLHLCDSMGFYVMDEVPFGYGDEHLKDTAYLPILLQRARSTIRRDKNRPCVIIWSVGNENPVTDMDLAVGRYVKELDNTRPYCFPQTPTVFKNMVANGTPGSIDILDEHYPSLADLSRLDTMFHRPLIFSEYAHAMGTGFGRMQAIYDVIYSHPKLAGGAVWEFFDQGILQKAPDRILKTQPTLYAWATPDSFYDTHGLDGMDGIVYANRIPQVDYWQVRKVYSPVIALDDTLQYHPRKDIFKLRLVNHYDFTNLSKVYGKWLLLGDTTVLDSGIISLNCRPHDTMAVKISTMLPSRNTVDFYYLKLLFENKKHYQFYEKTYQLHRQVSESIVLKNKMALNDFKPLKVDDTVVSKNYRFEWLKNSGSIMLKNKHGDTIITSGAFVRVGHKATVCEEAAKAWKNPNDALWRPYLLKEKKIQVDSFNAHHLMLTFECAPTIPKNESISGTINYKFNDSGDIRVSYHLTPKGSGYATAVGISFIIPCSLTEFRWIGKGPYAAYPGKDKLSDFGIYHLNSKDLYFPGNRQQVYCAIFSNKKGNGFALIANSTNVSVERTEGGIVVSQNAVVSSRFNKGRWPVHLYSFKDSKQIDGHFLIVPLTSKWPETLKELFGDPKTRVRVFQPFFNSYDQ